MADIKNVLLIVVDQWRGDTISHLGHPCIRTPNLDMLCRDGVTFRNTYTQGVPCGPARASLLTGQYMMNHRVTQNGVPMDARHYSLADALREAGYDPALVGYRFVDAERLTSLEFRDERRVIFSALGMRFAGIYELSQDDVIVEGPNGSIVFARDGDRLSGMGLVLIRSE